MSTYSIKDLEQLSGIKAHTLRIWEQRYSLLSPKRTDTNIRYYDDRDLKLILNVALLNDNGFKISKIASMDSAQIKAEVLRLSEQVLDFDDQIHLLTLCMIEMDEERFEDVLSNNIVQLGFSQTMLGIVYPFLNKIGILWQTGAINPAQEHFISNLVRQKLIVAIDGQSHQQDGKKFLLFLPEGELHEISLLFSCFLIKSRGHRVVYLGQSTPLIDLEFVYHLHQPDYLLTVMTTTPAFDQVENYLHSLAEKFAKAKILATGHQVLSQDHSLPPVVQLFSKILDLEEFLEEIHEGVGEK